MSAKYIKQINLIKKLLNGNSAVELIENEPLANHTSLKVGGPADLLCTVKNKDSLLKVYTLAQKENLPVFILGGGTNVLVSDKGIRGLVIKNNVKFIEIEKEVKIKYRNTDKPRYQESHWKSGFIKFTDLHYKNYSDRGVLVNVSSGTNLQMLMNYTLNKNLTGLQWFSRIPGTIGGAVFNNIHGGTEFIGNYIYNVTFIDTNNKLKTLKRESLNFKYNRSYFHDHKSLIISARLHLFNEDSTRAREIAKEWATRKSIQPFNSAGSTFSNLTDDEKNKAGLDNLSAGYIIDKVLNLKGYQVGGAKISERHANFIETKKGATAKDVKTIIDKVKKEAYEKLGVKLKEEIVLVGEF